MGQSSQRVLWVFSGSPWIALILAASLAFAPAASMPADDLTAFPLTRMSSPLPGDELPGEAPCSVSVSESVLTTRSRLARAKPARGRQTANAAAAAARPERIEWGLDAASGPPAPSTHTEVRPELAVAAAFRDWVRSQTW